MVRNGVASSTDPAHQLRTVVGNFTAWHAEAHTRARVVNYELAALTPEQFAGRDDVPLTVQIGTGMEPTLPSGNWLIVFASTNLYCHLSTVYAILRSHGGGLHYETEPAGSCFTVELWPMESPVEG